MIFYVHSHHGQEEKSTWMQLSQRVPMDEREYRRMEGSASRSLPVPNKGNDEIMRSDFPGRPAGRARYSAMVSRVSMSVYLMRHRQ